MAEQKTALADALNQAYSFSKATRYTAFRIDSPGQLYTVHVPGLRTRAMNQPVTIDIKPGQDVRERTSVLANLNGTVGNMRDVQVGEAFYLTTVDVDARYLTFHLITSETYPVMEQGASSQYRFGMNLRFPLTGNQLGSLTAADVHTMTDPVFSAGSTGQTTLQPGQTQAEVVQLLGPPNQEVDLGNKHILVYKSVKIALIDGKVTDIQ